MTIRLQDKVEGPIRIGVVGAGMWGTAHAEVFSRSNYSTLAAVCDSNIERASAMGTRFNVPSYPDIDSMIDGEQIDAVSIATPDFAHREPILAAANKGKHIFVEKPLATSREDLEAIERAVTASGVRLMVDFHARWSPPFYRAWQSVQSGEVGDVVSAYYRLNDTIDVPTSMLAWSGQSSILWFLGSHSIDTLRWILDDEITEVYSVFRRGVLDGLGIDAVDAYQTTLTFSKGTIAQIENNWIIPSSHPNINDIKMNVLGSRGMLDLDVTNNGVVRRFLPERYDEPDVFVKLEVHGRFPGFAHVAIGDFVEKLWRDDPFVVDMTDGIRVTEAILAIMESAETHKVVNIT